MKSVQNIPQPSWVTAEVQEIMSLLNGDDHAAMFVGGCVRNELLGVPVADIDIASVHTPEVNINLLKKNNQIKVIPTGIDHGTITAVLNGQSFEITTLRKDIETDGRHASVSYTQKWEEDAQRRDFTMNALYMNIEGDIYDPVGRRLADLKDKKVRFIGNAKERIQEDYLRILRFFRFFAQYGEGEIDQDGLKACTQYTDKITSLSRERITQEFFKILMTDKVPEILSIMFDADVLKSLRGEGYQKDRLQNLTRLQKEHQETSDTSSLTMARYFIVSGGRAVFHDDLLTFSKAQAGFVVKLESISNPVSFEDERTIKKAMFHHGRELVLQGYLLLMAQEKIQESASVLSLIKEWQIPECPITGEALLKEGYTTGPELGQELERRREEWLEENLS